jgi:hypothetical protein
MIHVRKYAAEPPKETHHTTKLPSYNWKKATARTPTKVKMPAGERAEPAPTAWTGVDG